nr:uncharacterized protein LOC126534072 isoform X6 [Dermacentor andersoni]
MSEKALFGAVLLLTSVTSATLNGVSKCAPALIKKVDIRKFVGTREPIWTWNTTTKERASCVVDEMKILTQRSIFFTRTFYINNELPPIVRNYMGIIPKQEPNAMELRRSDNHFPVKETILYLSEKCHCAVIRVTSSLRGGLQMSVEYLLYKAPDSSCAVVKVRSSFDRILDHYDLRVRNSSATAGPRPMCKRWFSQVAPHGRVIYNRNCERLLRPWE